MAKSARIHYFKNHLPQKFSFRLIVSRVSQFLLVFDIIFRSKVMDSAEFYYNV